MRLIKTPVAIAVILLVAFDGMTVSRIWLNGWPKRVTLTNTNDATRFEIHVTRLAFTSWDWLLMASVVLLHVGLFWLAWRAWCVARQSTTEIPPR